MSLAAWIAPAPSNSRAENVQHPLSLAYPASKGISVILTKITCFSKMAHFSHLPKLPASKMTAEVMLSHGFRLHCLPQDFVSDQDPQIPSCFWKENPLAYGRYGQRLRGFSSQVK